MPELKNMARLRVIGTQGLFVSGLALQKGAPILLAPLIIRSGGVEAYGSFNYVLALCQFCAMVMSLGLTQIIIPVWHSQVSPARFIRNSAFLLMLTSSLIGLVVVAPTVFMLSKVPTGFSQVGFAFIVLFIAFGLNALNWSTQMARVLQKAPVFFVISIGGPVALIVTLILYEGASVLVVLLLVHGLMALISPLFIAGGFSGLGMRQEDPPAEQGYNLSILRQSMTLFGYSVATVAVINIDKVILNHYFSLVEFSQYTADFQMSFSILIVPTVLNFVTLPKVGELISKNNNIIANRITWIASLGGVMFSILAGTIIYFYASITKVPLSYGFFIFCLGFLMHGIYIQKSGLQMARQKFQFLFKLNFFGAIIFFSVILAAVVNENINIAYWSWPFYSTFLLGVTAVLDWRRRAAMGAPTDG